MLRFVSLAMPTKRLELQRNIGVYITIIILGLLITRIFGLDFVDICGFGDDHTGHMANASVRFSYFLS